MGAVDGLEHLAAEEPLALLVAEEAEAVGEARVVQPVRPGAVVRVPVPRRSRGAGRRWPLGRRVRRGGGLAQVGKGAGAVFGAEGADARVVLGVRGADAVLSLAAAERAPQLLLRGQM